MANAPRVLVVGGGLGIGESITKLLIDRHQGRVVVTGLRVSAKVRAMHHDGRLRLIEGDITSESVREETRKTVFEFLGGLDCLVCTVGIMGQVQLIRDMDVSALRRTYDVNLFAPVAMCQLFLPALRHPGGKIIILSSRVDKAIQYSGWMQYCSSKAAVTRFIENLAHEEPDIQVYGVYPGLTKTTMPDDVIAGKYEGIMKQEEVDRFLKWDKEGSIEPPEWCASVVARMCTDFVPAKGSGQCHYYHEYRQDFK